MGIHDTHQYPINVPATQTQGAAREIHYLIGTKWVQFEVEVVAAGSVTMQLQGHIRTGGAWVNIGDPMTTDDILEVPEELTEVRIDRTVAGTGTPIVTIFGRIQ